MSDAAKPTPWQTSWNTLTEADATQAPAVFHTNVELEAWLANPEQPFERTWITSQRTGNLLPSLDNAHVVEEGTEAPETPPTHFLLKPDGLPPAYGGELDTAVFTTLPTSLQQLSQIARRTSKQIVLLGQTDAKQEASSADQAATLQAHLDQLAQEATDRRIYVSISDLMTALDLPLAPQPEFDRGAQTVTNLLAQLKQEDFLLEQHEVSFQVKLHNAFRFQEKEVQKDEDQLAFWQHYEAMKQALPPFDALSLTFHNGRTIDLRKLSQHMPYHVAQLNTLLKTLLDKELLVGELTATSTHHAGDQELQLRVGHPHASSQGLRLWTTTDAHRQDILQAILSPSPLSDAQSEALRQMGDNTPQEAAFWEGFHALLSPTQDKAQVIQLTARALAWLEQEETQANLVLWEGCTAFLGLTGLDVSTLHRALCAPHAAPIEIVPFVQWMLQARKDDANLLRYYTNYALDIKETDAFSSEAEAHLEREAEHILSRNTTHRMGGALRRYARLAKRWKEQHPEANPPAWSMTAAWTFFLLNQQQAATEWSAHLLALPLSELNDTLPTHGTLRLAQIATKNKQGQQVIDIIYPTPEDCILPQKQLQQLQRDAFRQLLAGNNKSAAEPTSLQERLTYRLHPELTAKTADWLRNLLEPDQPGHDDKHTQRTVLRILVARGEATPIEIEQLTQWLERKGDRSDALELRSQLREQAPENADNLRRIAQLTIQLQQPKEALEAALQANRLAPQKYPLERFIKQHQGAFFSDLKQLRELLIDLPAHPAFTSIEDELEAREALQKQLKPKLQTIETLLNDNKLGEARDKTNELVDQHGELLPPAFIELHEQVQRRIGELKKQIAHPPHRDPKKRNKLLETLAKEAQDAGLPELTDEAFRRLLNFNPQYGLGYLKWARSAARPKQRKHAYQKAIELSRTPEQKMQNSQEYADYLEKEGDHRALLDLLIQVAKDDTKKAQRRVEPYLMRLAQSASQDEEIMKEIDEFIASFEQPKAFKKVKKTVEKLDELEPWKRALLSIKPK
jgi:hypothetical protein